MDSIEIMMDSSIETIEENENENNIKLMNIINQIRLNNKGYHQPLKILYIRYINYKKVKMVIIYLMNF